MNYCYFKSLVFKCMKFISALDYKAFDYRNNRQKQEIAINFLKLKRYVD